MPAILTRGKVSVTLETVDLSFSGIFLATPKPPPLRELVKLQIDLPGDSIPIRLMGMAVHVVHPGGPRAPGVGVQLYGNDPRTIDRWETFVAKVRDHDEVEELVTCELPKLHPEFRVRVPSLADLELIRARDIAKGKTFIKTEVYLDVGTEVGIQFVHPVTQRSFALEGVVLKVVRSEQMKGLGVRFTDLEEARRRDFERFVADPSKAVSVDMGCALDDFPLTGGA